MLRFAYNSNGLQSHRIIDALDLLVRHGYQGVALTLDHMHLDPLYATEREISALGQALRERQLAVSIESGARYVLDPHRKHWPALTDPDPALRQRRLAFLERCLDIAEALQAESLVLFSGLRPQDPEQAWGPLIDALGRLMSKASPVPLALEPEPGHLVATLPDFARCRKALPGLGLALDIGHVPVTEPGRSIAATIHEFREALKAVHIEDSHGLVHEHLPFGEGNLDHRAILEALVQIRFKGLVAVELSRHSHAAHELVPQSMDYLKAIHSLVLPAVTDHFSQGP